MSKREDIIDGAEALTAEKGLIYTKKLGWIDLGHARGKDARDLRDSLASEHPVKTLQEWQQYLLSSPATILSAITTPAVALSTLSPFATIPAHCQHYPYFPVYYDQTMGANKWNIQLKVGVKGTFLVRAGLSEQLKASIALTIMQRTSHRFEALQQRLPYSLVTDSGYSAEDLLSNLVGFYRIFRDTKSGYIDPVWQAEPMSKEYALKIWDTYGPVGSHKNYTFRPLLFPEPPSVERMLASQASLPKDPQELAKLRQQLQKIVLQQQPRKGVLPSWLTYHQAISMPAPELIIPFEDLHYSIK